MERENDWQIAMGPHDVVIRTHRIAMEVDDLGAREVRTEPGAEVPSSHNRRIPADFDSVDRIPGRQRFPRLRLGRRVDDDTVTTPNEPAAEPAHAVLESADFRVEVGRDVVNRESPLRHPT